MKYVSIDLETTGLDPRVDQVLMAAMVLEDTEINCPVEELLHFHCLVRHKRYFGDAFALNLNAPILKILSSTTDDRFGFADYKDQRIVVYRDHEWENEALDWLDHHFPDGRAVAAGKNVAGFDLRFLSESLNRKFYHRVIDPGSVCINWEAKVPPSLGELKDRYKIDGPVAHDALEDARDVIRVLRKTYDRAQKEAA
jgi:oligoribonuclease